MNLIDYLSNMAADYFQRERRFGGYEILGPVERGSDGSIGFIMSHNVCGEYGLDEGCTPIGAVSFHIQRSSVISIFASMGTEEMNGFLAHSWCLVPLTREDTIKLRLDPTGGFMPSKASVDGVLAALRSASTQLGD